MTRVASQYLVRGGGAAAHFDRKWGRQVAPERSVHLSQVWRAGALVALPIADAIFTSLWPESRFAASSVAGAFWTVSVVVLLYLPVEIWRGAYSRGDAVSPDDGVE